jgi:deferrochelatase/peroxidase EfeB
VEDKLKLSHVQRANHHRQDFENPESLRIYRQGYEFAESVQSTGVPRVGLNFVAFHDSPFRVTEMLTRTGWLGGVNFGGELSTSATLIQVAAAGIYLIPATKTGELFPGADIFL